MLNDPQVRATFGPTCTLTANNSHVLGMQVKANVLLRFLRPIWFNHGAIIAPWFNY